MVVGDYKFCNLKNYVFRVFNNNKYGLLTKREVKLAENGPNSFFRVYEPKSKSINTQRKNEVNIQPS